MVAAKPSANSGFAASPCRLLSPPHVVATSGTAMRPAIRPGFTLVELMAALAIIGVLMSLLITAVQASREMARKTACASNLHNQLLALHEFQAVHRYFPAGRQFSPTREYSWCL